MRKILLFHIYLFLLWSCTVQPKEAQQTLENKDVAKRWTEEEANSWYEEKGWLIGSNFAPSSAINQLEMWQEESFDTATINRELGWAKSLGFNSMRVFLHHILWDQDSVGFLNRMDTYLKISERHGIGTMFVLFDGVWDPNPRPGKQRDPKPHVHNSGWLQSPGVEILSDTSRHDEMEPYVKGVIRNFANDSRVDVWDLFNEPDNMNRPAYVELEPENKAELSLYLLKKSFEWAREVDPSQPLTAGIWLGDWSDTSKLKPLDKFMVNASDVISFHNYDGPDVVEQKIKQLKVYNRPILCTEYMARGNNSTFEGILPIFKKHNIGAYNWGFVAGKSQTIYPWDSWTKEYTDEPDLWFHDIFRKDGTPYREEEVELIREITGVR